MKKGTIIYLLFMVCMLTFSVIGHAQTTYNIDNDSLISASIDTMRQGNKFYENIHNAAKKRKWSNRLFDLVFDYSPPANEIEKNEDTPIESAFIPYAGKPIRYINITTLSPFGTDINNPDTVKTNWLNGAFNSIHTNTRKFVIHANLLFKEKDLVAPHLIAEAETYLRELSFVGDARIILSQVLDSDSVDVKVIVQDKFSKGFDIKNISFSKFDVELYDRNIFGLGSGFGIRYLYNKNGDYLTGYGIRFADPNIFRTFFRTEFSYLKDNHSKTIKASIERPIQTNLKYIGGVSYTHKKAPTKILLLNDTTFQLRQEVFSATFGRIFKINSTNPYSRLVVSSRFLFQNNLSNLIKSSKYPYLNYPFEKKSLWLSSVSLFQQQHYRGSMIYNYGTTEDIAYGYNVTAQVGYENHVYFDRTYASIGAAAGKNFKFGYVYTKGEYGSYFRNGRPEQGILRFYTSYFSPLIKLKRGTFRQFSTIDYTEGIRRLNGVDELIFFSHLTDLDTDKYNYQANGIRRLVFNTESDWFSPVQVLGFRMVYFAFVNLGWLGGKKDRLFSNDNFFSGYGIGVRTRNNQLFFKTIELKLAWYPQLNQSKMSDYYDLSTSDPKVSPNFRPDYPSIIPFK